MVPTVGIASQKEKKKKKMRLEAEHSKSDAKIVNKEKKKKQSKVVAEIQPSKSFDLSPCSGWADQKKKKKKKEKKIMVEAVPLLSVYKFANQRKNRNKRKKRASFEAYRSSDWDPDCKIAKKKMIVLESGQPGTKIHHPKEEKEGKKEVAMEIEPSKSSIAEKEMEAEFEVANQNKKKKNKRRKRAEIVEIPKEEKNRLEAEQSKYPNLEPDTEIANKKKGKKGKKEKKKEKVVAAETEASKAEADTYSDSEFKIHKRPTVRKPTKEMKEKMRKRAAYLEEYLKDYLVNVETRMILNRKLMCENEQAVMGYSRREMMSHFHNSMGKLAAWLSGGPRIWGTKNIWFKGTPDRWDPILHAIEREEHEREEKERKEKGGEIPATSTSIQGGKEDCS